MDIEDCINPSYRARQNKRSNYNKMVDPAVIIYKVVLTSHYGKTRTVESKPVDSPTHALIIIHSESGSKN